MSSEKYTEDELCTMYRDAKDKSKQIKILADMANTSQEKVIEMLNAHGMISGVQRKRKPSANFVFTPELTSDLHRLYQQGMKPAEIAEHLGIPVEKVRKKIENDKRRGLLQKSIEKQKEQSEDVSTQKPIAPSIEEKTLKQPEKRENQSMSLVSAFEDLRRFVGNCAENVITSFYVNEEDRQLVINFMRGDERYCLHLEEN